MNYISTRGDMRARTFSQAVLEGLAEDGGLLVPEELPDLSSLWPNWGGLSYPELSFEILKHLATDFTETDLKDCCETAYGVNYGAQVAPLKKVGPYFVLELIHGPTLAFKDVALQLLGRLFESILKRQDRTLNIVAATSGDTGSAAIYGLKDVERVKIFVTHPEGRIAPLQRRQMTTVINDSVFNISVKGSFDDCQQMMKELSCDLDFKHRYKIGAVNSINFARIAAQIVYYFAAYLQTPAARKKTPAVFAVPTGNFGNILAAEYARRMGLPIGGLILASNENDILPTFFNTGVYQKGTPRATHSPAMDIQVASNFERYLWLLSNRDGGRVNDLMKQFQSTNQLKVPKTWGHSWRALSCSDEATLDTAERVFQEQGYLLDPHTATAWWAMERSDSHFDPSWPRIVVATAHPAKFPDVLKQRVPADSDALVHPTLLALASKKERLFHLPAETHALKEFVSRGVESAMEGVFLWTEEKAARHG